MCIFIARLSIIVSDAAIAGAMAEVFYGVPENMKNNARTYLEDDMQKILELV